MNDKWFLQITTEDALPCPFCGQLCACVSYSKDFRSNEIEKAHGYSCHNDNCINAHCWELIPRYYNEIQFAIRQGTLSKSLRKVFQEKQIIDEVTHQ